ncbi:MAG: hypothetical protein ACO3E4_08060, partial [Candidatus Nanopelagicaceae bacterium]
FADAAARTTALTSVLAEGMMSYLQDTNSVEVYNGSSWVNVGNAGDITEVQAGVGISIASGTGPIPVITNSSTDLITTAGDILYGTAADTVARLGIGTAGQVLKVNSGATAPEWGAAAGAGALTKITSATFSNVADTGTTFDAVFTSTYKNYLITFFGIYGSVNEANFNFRLRNAGSTTTTAYYGNNVVGVTKTDTSNAAAFNVGKVRDGSTQQMCLTMTFNRSNNRIGWSYYGWERVSNYSLIGGGFNDSIVADGSDGFILSASSGNIYGTVTVYGLEA